MDERRKSTARPEALGSRGPNAPFSAAPARAAAKTSRRASALFNALSMDPLLREQFVTDPAQVMAEYLFAERLSEDAADTANQLLFSVMSDKRLRDWLVRYSGGLGGEMPSRHEFARQFSRAVAASGDDLTALALIRGAAEERDHFVMQSDLLRAFVTVIGGRLGQTGTEMSSPGTEVSPGTATEISPSAIFSGTEKSSPGTEVSPGTATDISPGAIFSGTNMSPGTLVTPGTGTHISPGAPSFGIDVLTGDIAVTLDALARFATDLRARGALESTGLEGR